jgi:hypothetical protein
MSIEVLQADPSVTLKLSGGALDEPQRIAPPGHDVAKLISGKYSITFERRMSALRRAFS